MKVKQKIAMALCLFYLFSVIGLAISMHYCSGKLSSVRFTESAKCSVCKQEQKVVKTHNCCKTTDLVVKVKDSHQGGLKVKLPENFGLQLFSLPRISEWVTAFRSRLVRLSENKAPPLSSVISLHLYHCVFRN
jgi:hypothetical protein